MNEIQIFTSELFGSVRTLEQNDGKILFCGKDVASALGYKVPKDAISTHCKGGGKTPPPYIRRNPGSKFYHRGRYVSPNHAQQAARCRKV